MKLIFENKYDQYNSLDAENEYLGEY